MQSKTIWLIVAALAAALGFYLFKRNKMIQTFQQKLMSMGQKGGLPENLLKFIIAQSKYETSVKGIPYMSRNFIVNNNAFGYKFVKGNKWQIQGNVSPEGDSYAKYATQEDGINDIIRHYKKRLSSFVSVTTPQEFANVLKTQEYFGQTSDEYAKGVAHFYTA